MKRRLRNCAKEEARFTPEYFEELRKARRERADRWTAKRDGRCPYEALIGAGVLLALFFWAMGKIGGLF